VLLIYQIFSHFSVVFLLALHKLVLKASEIMRENSTRILKGNGKDGRGTGKELTERVCDYFF